MICLSRRTRRWSTAAIAWRARSGSPPLEMTAQLWLIESIWHSSLVDDPRGVPSSNQARRYQAPSQAWASTLPRSSAAWLLHTPAKAVSLRSRARPANSSRFSTRNHASHTLSPLPSLPTRFMPSFQSPQPISGN